ncbi:MAG: hydroxypyruvate isomerase family protein [Burkholderiaceae bacterium]
MPKLAANLSMMYNELPFLERFEAAAQDGFKGVEFLFPYDFKPAEVRAALNAAGLSQVLFNAPPGQWSTGERGIASLPGREKEFLQGLEQAIEYAKALECPCIHLMAGLFPAGADRAAHQAAYIANLRAGARRLAAEGLTGLIEPINTRDIPGFFLNRQDQARAVIEAVGEPNLRIQMDLYHCQIVEGDLAMKIREYLPLVGHFQIAGVPERHEPDLGEIHYPYLFELIDSLGFDGWIGCEYRPAAATRDGLGWFARWRA